MLYPGSSFRFLTTLVCTSESTLWVTKDEALALAQGREFWLPTEFLPFSSTPTLPRSLFSSLLYTHFHSFISTSSSILSSLPFLYFDFHTTAMASPSLVPDALQHLADTLRSLPPHTSLGNTTLLSSLLHQFSVDVGPLLSIVLENERDALLSNSSWISTHLSELQHLISRLPPSTVAHASHQELVTFIKFDSLKYTFWTTYTADIYTLLLLFIIAIIAKLLFNFGLRKAAVDRTQAALSAKYGHEVDREVARSALKKYVGSMFVVASRSSLY